MQEQELFNTPLRACHEELGARMVPFAGWNMPVQYPEGIIAEHLHTRKHVSLFDICHMGEFIISGAGAVTALDRIFARPVFNQKVGICRYNFLLDAEGHVMDDLIVYRVEEEKFFVVVNAGTREGDARRICDQLPENIVFEDVSDSTAKLDLQGPEAAEVLVAAGLEVEDLPAYFKFKYMTLNGVEILLSRTGYTGELGFELYFDAKKAVSMWNYLLSFKQVKPAGLGARDTLRLEVGYALYGHEMDDTRTPVDAGYGPMLKIKDFPERDFTGKSALVAAKPEFKLVAIQLEGRRAARAGAAIFNKSGEEIGKVTSGAFAPSISKAVAMGYVRVESGLDIGSQVDMTAGRSKIAGVISELPFYTEGTVRKKL